MKVRNSIVTTILVGMVFILNFALLLPTAYASNEVVDSQVEYPEDRVDRIADEIIEGKKQELSDTVFMRGEGVYEHKYVVYFKNSTGKAGIRSVTRANSELKTNVKRSHKKVFAVEVDLDPTMDTQKQLEQLSDDPNVIAVTQVGERELTAYPNPPDDPRFPVSNSYSNSYQWHLNQSASGNYGIDILRAWGYLDSNGKSYGGDSSILVAVIDSGLAYETYTDASTSIDYGISPDSDTNLYVNSGETPANSIDDDGNGCVDDINGVDFDDNSCAHPNDMMGHGTAVSNIISAQVNNTTSGSGIAPNIKILPIKIFGYTWSGSVWNKSGGSVIDVGDAITYAVDAGAKIINMSFGGVGAYVYEELAADDAYYNNDVLLVAASGNRDYGDPVEYPAAYDSVIAVGASTKSGSRVSYSSYGSEIELVAPVDAGLPIETYTCYFSATSSNPVCPNTHESSSYSTFSNTSLTAGTSFAAPQVAGVAALLRTMYPTWNAEQIRYVLKMSAYRKDGNRFDTLMGYGILNAFNAVRAVDQNGKSLKNRYRVVHAVRGTDGNVYTRYSGDFGTQFDGWYKESNREGTLAAVTMVYHNATDKLIQYKRGTNSRIYWRFSSDFGESWTNWVNNGYTQGRVDVVKVNGNRLLMSIRGLDNGIYTRYSDNGGVSWSSWIKNGSTPDDINTSYDELNNRVIQVVRGMDNGIYTRYSATNGRTWSKWVRAGATPGQVAMISLLSRTTQAVRGMDNGVYTRYSDTGGSTWTKWVRSGSTLDNPSLVTMDGRSVLLAVKGGNSGIWMRYSPNKGMHWASWYSNSTVSGSVPMVYNSYYRRVYQTVRKSNRAIYTRYSDDFGATWSAFSGGGSGFSEVSMVDINTANW